MLAPEQKQQHFRRFCCQKNRPIGGDAVRHSISVSKFALATAVVQS